MSHLRRDEGPDLAGGAALHMRSASIPRNSRERESGFTLIELLVVVTIMPLIIGTISLAFFATSKIEVSVSNQLRSSGNAQVISSTFARDVHNATNFTTELNPTSPAQCGSGSQVVSMEWPDPTSTSSTNWQVVSYSLTPTSITTPVVQDNLVRFNCTYDTSTGSFAIAGTQMLSSNVVPNSANSVGVSVSGQSCSPISCSYGNVWSVGWTSATGITNIAMSVNEAANNTSAVDSSCSGAGLSYCFNLSAVPRSWSDLDLTMPLAGVAGAEILNSYQGCQSNNANVYVNGTLVINTQFAGGNNVYAQAVDYYYAPRQSDQVPAVNSSPPNVQPLPPLTSITPVQYTTQAQVPLLGLTRPSTVNPQPQPSGTTNLTPGVYSSITSRQGVNLVLSPGVYVVVGGALNSNGGTITSAPGGVMIYLANGATANLGGLFISAPVNGPYAGIALWQSGSVLTITGSGQQNNLGIIDGLIYAPSATLSMTGNTTLAASNILVSGSSCNGGGVGTMDIGFTQSITINPPSSTTYNVGNQVTLSATGGGSGNPVTYTIATNSSAGTCTLNGATITFAAAGTCVVDANQKWGQHALPSSSKQVYYLDAPTVQLAFQVTTGGS